MAVTLNDSRSITRNLNNNAKNASASLTKISSGFRIPAAKFDASVFAISTRMREQLRALQQDQQNVQNGSSLFRVAEGGIDTIIQNVRRIKELAINSANDSNTDTDRKTIQKEVDASLLAIEDIAVGTEYNGIKLLDGTLAKVRIMDVLLDTHSEPDGIRSTITNSITIYEENSVYEIDDSVGICTITIAANNVKIIGSDSAQDVSIVMQNSGSLWLENFMASSSSDKSIIDFRGDKNFLHLLGTNSITNSNNNSTATIHAGGNLTICGEENTGDNGSLTITRSGGTRGAMIGSNDGEYSNSSNITILSGTFNLTGSQTAAAIGAGGSASIGDITIYDGTFNLGSGQGSAALGNNQGTPNVIKVYGGDITATRLAERGDDAYVVGGNTSSIQFTGGKIHIENVKYDSIYGVAVEPSYNLPGIFSDYHRVYDQDLNNAKFDDSIYIVKPFAIHTGTKSSQMNLLSIESMRPDALGIDALDVTTQEKALSAIGRINAAVEYALDVAADVGASMERLEFTESNIQIKAENTALSNSVLRDADMAREMTEYTKSNILLQVSQSMLAQANQNQSQVLSLLQ
ncbi:MAG: hypothetical protein IJ575_07630 [Selenomonadaceae bacterium]|nr:hypothetical protein [Selenomonadaceae bacterium]